MASLRIAYNLRTPLFMTREYGWNNYGIIECKTILQKGVFCGMKEFNDSVSLDFADSFDFVELKNGMNTVWHRFSPFGKAELNTANY